MSTIQVRQAGLAVSSTFDFGNGIVTVAGSPVVFMIVNTGSSTVQIGGSGDVQVTGANAADFALTPPPVATLSGGQSTSFSVAFSPASTGSLTATVTVAPQSGANSVSFSATGTGVDFGVEGPDGTPVSTYDFAVQTSGLPSSAATFTVLNKGSAPVALAVVNMGGANSTDFSAGGFSPSSTVNPNSSVTFTLTFTPGSYGARSATATVAASGGTPSYAFGVIGTGTSGSFALTDGSSAVVSDGQTIDYRMITTTTNSFPYTIHNQTAGADVLSLLNSTPSITVTSGGNPNAFAVVPSMGNTVSAPNGQWTYSVITGYSGLAMGTYTAVVTIQTSDINHLTFSYNVTMYYKGHL